MADYYSWEVGYETECDWCRKLVTRLFQVPDGTESGEEDSVCEDCATNGPPQGADWDTDHVARELGAP
jgi:hypothetical protein